MSFPNGDDDTGDLGEPRLESEAKLLKTWKGDDIKDVLRLGVDGFFFEAESGGEFSSAPKFSLMILLWQFFFSLRRSVSFPKFEIEIVVGE